MEKISEIIKETRLSLGLSQERLAAKANVTTRTVLSTEGGHKCSVQTLMAICKALGLEVVVSKKE